MAAQRREVAQDLWNNAQKLDLSATQSSLDLEIVTATALQAQDVARKAARRRRGLQSAWGDSSPEESRAGSAGEVGPPPEGNCLFMLEESPSNQASAASTMDFHAFRASRRAKEDDAELDSLEKLARGFGRGGSSMSSTHSGVSGESWLPSSMTTTSTMPRTPASAGDMWSSPGQGQLFRSPTRPRLMQVGGQVAHSLGSQQSFQTRSTPDLSFTSPGPRSFASSPGTTASERPASRGSANSSPGTTSYEEPDARQWLRVPDPSSRQASRGSANSSPGTTSYEGFHSSTLRSAPASQPIWPRVQGTAQL